MSGPKIIHAQTGGQIADVFAKPENPRAFPSSAIDDRFGGIGLRDWFAGQALVGFTSLDDGGGDCLMGAADAARASYNYADAMLAEREKGVFPSRTDLIDALASLHRDARPSNWSDEDQPGEPGFEAAAAWRNMDAVLAAANGGAA